MLDSSPPKWLFVEMFSWEIGLIVVGSILETVFIGVWSSTIYKLTSIISPSFLKNYELRFLGKLSAITLLSSVTKLGSKFCSSLVTLSSDESLLIAPLWNLSTWRSRFHFWVNVMLQIGKPCCYWFYKSYSLYAAEHSLFLVTRKTLVTFITLPVTFVNKGFSITWISIYIWTFLINLS